MLISFVKNNEGPCVPVWLNTNKCCNRLDGGTTGFFKNTKRILGIRFRHGKEFHGIINYKSQVHSTTKEATP